MQRFLVIAVCLLMFASACKKTEAESVDEQVQVDQSQAKAASLFTESMVSPKFGVPNSTYYYFQVFDPSGALALSVKLFERTTGTTTYIPMIRVGSLWTLSTRIATNGWYDWRYVYSVTKGNIGTTAYTLCNSRNVFSSTGTSSISWPFGADGSSFTSRLMWIGAMESGGCGSGWNAAGHTYHSCNADDSYAEDWNKNCSSSNADNGAVVRSPLDGKVVRVFIDSPTNHNGGYGNAIDVQQESPNGTFYTFRIAHLKYAPTLVVGNSVRAGVTTIGYIGMTGGTSSAPHAHCALYRVSNSCNTKAKFAFNAQ